MKSELKVKKIKRIMAPRDTILSSRYSQLRVSPSEPDDRFLIVNRSERKLVAIYQLR